MNNSQPAHLGLTYQTSEARFPAPTPPSGPNVVLIMFDDLGFADLGCYGSEIRTPNIDALAASGQRYSNFHTTTLCSPSRACLLTGRNHHAVGMRMLSNTDSGWPSGRGRISRNAALISEILQEAGYNTFATGKWHVAPMREVSAAGPYGEWPLGRGFNQFYGFMNGATDHFYPELVHDNHFTVPPRGPEDGYHLTEDLIDRATSYIADHISQHPELPFFHYLPLGAAHAPHHAPATNMDAVRGRYDVGWDEIRRQRYERQLDMGIIPPGTQLPPQNPDAPAWDSLTDAERRVAARLQEAYAAMVEHTDQQIGRLIESLRETGCLDDTLVILTSDNGAAMEGGRLGAYSRIRFFNGLEEDFDQVLGALDEVGGPLADSHYATGWAQASNTPGRWYKYHTHGGGVRDPLIVSWADKLSSPGTILQQFHHITDIAPTIYEVTGVNPPDNYRGVPQMPIHGKSLAYTFADPDAPTVRRVQYFEMFGNRALWADGWKAVTRHFKDDDYSEAEWELYHLDDDFSESTNLAETHPDKLRELVNMWWAEAGKYDVLPLDDRSVELMSAPPNPGSPLLRETFEYFAGTSHVEASTVPPFEYAPEHRIEADISGEKQGVLLAYGGIASGFVLYLDKGELRYEYNAAGNVTQASLPIALDAKRVTVGIDFVLNADRTGRGRIYVGERQGDWFDIPVVFRFLALTGMDIAKNTLSPISQSFNPPFHLVGKLHKVTVTLVQTGDTHRRTLDD